MRRNNGWLAVLAVSVVLSILRNSLAGERYPLDYGNDQLSVNRGKVAYGARGTNGPSLNFQNRSNTPSPRYSSKLSSSSTSVRQTSHPLVKNDATVDPSKAISWRAAEAADANQLDEDSGDDRSIRLHDRRERTRRLRADRAPSDDCHEERRNKHRAREVAVPIARGSTGFVAENSLKIPEEPRLSSRITRVAIKDTARGGSDATRRLTNPSTPGSLKTAPCRSEPLDHEYPYYGHVEADSRDDDSLKASRREIEDVRRQRGFRGELRGLGIGRSDGAGGQRTMDHFQGDDIEASQSSGDSVETATDARQRYPTEIPESAVVGKLFDAELKLVDSGKFSGRKPSRGSVKRYLIESSISVNQPLKIERLKLQTLTGRERPKSRMVRNVNLWNVETKEFIQKRYFTEAPKSSISGNELFDRELKPNERSKNRRRRNKSMYELMSTGSVKNSGTEPDEKSRTFNPGDVIKLERSYLWQNSGSSNRGPRSDRVQAVETEGRTHHSSEFEGSQRTSTSHKSTLTRGQMHTRRLNGISAKQISTKGSDDEADRRTRGSSSIRGKRNIIPSSGSVALDSSHYGEASSTVTFNETINDSLANNTDNDAKNVETELELDLISENLTDNSLDARAGIAIVQQWNDSTLDLSTLTSSNEFSSTSYDESTESFDRITLEEPDVSGGNNSQLLDITMLNGELNSTLIKRKFVQIITNSEDAQLPGNVPNLSNETVSTRPDLNTDSSQGMKLDAPRSEIDEAEEDANKATPEEGSALSNVTKETEGVLVNSERSSVAALRNATYLTNDMNSLAEGSYASESSGVSEFGERNSDDTFKNSSSIEQERKAAEDIKINANLEQSPVNKAKHFERSPASKRVVLQTVEIKNRKIGNQLEWLDRFADDEMENDEVTFNEPLILSMGQNSVDSRTTELPNRNIQTRDDDIKPNEPSGGFSSKNERARASSLDNGTVNEVNPYEKDEKSSDGPLQRPSNRFNSSNTMLTPVIDHPMRERKSRSSTARTSTSSSRKLDSTTKVEGPVSGQTSTPMWDKDVDHRSNISTMRTESIPAKASNDTLKGLTVSLTRSLDFVSSAQDSSTTLFPSDQPTNGPLDNYLNENLTLSSARMDQPPVTVETSTAELVNDENQFSFAFDMIATPSEPSDEYFPVTVDEASSQTTDNSSHEREPPDQWPVKHSAVVEGDLVLGGLMMVHEREDTITCGPVMPQGGVQALEAMLYTLDRLNDRGIVPGVKIGAHILDDCDKDTYGLEMAVDFIKGSISNIDGAEYHCNKTAVRKVISGVVGAASSVTSIQVANLLRLFRIPQVSFFSTSPELSNKQRFEYFTRTIPSDHYQVKAMVDIVLTMGWSYVSIIYEESNYGIKAFEELEELLGKNDICIAVKEKLVKDSGVAEETAYDNIVLKLLTKPRARGCIIFGSDQEVAGVMRAVRRCNATGAFSWIGSDGWSARGLVSNGNEPEVEGTLSVQPQANPVKGFEEYFLNLTVENNRRNPWFVEFWEDHFQCRYPNASKTPYNQKYTKPCTMKERLTKQNTAFEDQLQFVSDAVMAFAYAFRDMHKDLCQGKPGLCDAMKPTKGTELLKYLRKVDFEGLSGDKFKFDKNGDGPARYNIIHFKQIELGKYKWIRVGKYLEGELRLNMSEIQFKLGHPQPPESVCSLSCEVGQAKKYVEGERCCWHCFNCTQYQIRDPKDETQCIVCRQGTVPDETHSACRDIPEEFLRPESGWAIGAMSFSATGILITFFVCGVFLKHYETPVVRASGRELSYVLLSGILLCYLVTFALVLRPTDIVCGIQRFAAGFCFTVVYAALLTKTNRISRIFNASKHSAKRPSFISPRSQLIICFGLVFVQILINGVWMIIDPAKAMHHYPTREDNLLVCNSYVDASYMIAFAYPIMLIVVCTVYAVLTRKIPEAFNESKHIGFTMYTTCVIWLAFVPLYFGTGNNVALRITSMSVTISLSASVTIACLFSPKLYIILIRPERNVRQSMMPARYSTTKSSAVTATNASSMITPVTLTAAMCDQNKAVKKHIIATLDCSTQSEYYELEVKDRKNGKLSPTVVSRSTQTSNNNDKDSNAVVSSKESKEGTTTTKPLNNNARIGNGPVNQSDVPL